MKLHTIVLFACVAGLWAVACRSFRAADLLPTKVGLGYSDSDGRFDADSHPEGSWGNQHTDTSGGFGGHTKSVGAEWEPFAGEHIAANEERRVIVAHETAYAALGQVEDENRALQERLAALESAASRSPSAAAPTLPAEVSAPSAPEHDSSPWKSVLPYAPALALAVLGILNRMGKVDVLSPKEHIA